MWLLKFIRVVGVGVWVFAKRRPLITFLVVFYGGFLVWGVIGRLNETPQQTQAREMIESREAVAAASRESEQKVERERNRLLCKVKSTCERYGQVRQECAAAGNFQNCIRVKMGDEDYELIGSCANDGRMDASLERGAVDCFFSRLFP